MVSFFSKTERREVGTTVNTGPCVLLILCALLACADLVIDQEMLDAASVEGEPNGKVCETADALKWKDSGFPVSRIERRENVTPNLLDFL